MSTLKAFLKACTLMAAGYAGAAFSAPSTSPQTFIQGPPNARYSVTLYADLECPFCKRYSPEIERWVLSRSDTNLVWRHLPLSIHEPAASLEAQVAECAGALGGNTAFWQMTTAIFEHTQGDGAGLKGTPLTVPGVSSTDIAACVSSGRFSASVAQQADAARARGINDTPSLVVTDNVTGRDVRLTGPADENVLLSALDLLGASPSDQ